MVDNDRFFVPMIFFAHLAFMVVHVKDFEPNAQPFRPVVEIIRCSGCYHILQCFCVVFANAHTQKQKEPTTSELEVVGSWINDFPQKTLSRLSHILTSISRLHDLQRKIICFMIVFSCSGNSAFRQYGQRYHVRIRSSPFIYGTLPPIVLLRHSRTSSTYKLESI